MRNLFIFCAFIVGVTIHSAAQCNGMADICDKRYDEVAFLTTHNAFNAQSESFTFPNQTFGLTQQLNDGVRGLMLDVYDQNGTPVVYHGTSILGSQHLSENFDEIKLFLDNNPNEIVTIIFECYVSANAIENVLNGTGLSTYLYEKPAGDWDFIQTMIDNNTRLVIFSDQDDASPSQQWYHYVWDYAVETHYSVNNINDFNNDFNRGDSINDLFIFNHFVTDAILGIGQSTESAIVNDYNFLMSRIEENYSEKLKFPNFVTLDFYDLGDGKEVVDSLNSNTFANLQEHAKSSIEMHPNPSTISTVISGLNPMKTYHITIVDLSGKTSAFYRLNFTTEITISTVDLNDGIYIVQIQSNTGTMINKRLIVN